MIEVIIMDKREYESYIKTITALKLQVRQLEQLNKELKSNKYKGGKL